MSGVSVKSADATDAVQEQNVRRGISSRFGSIFGGKAGHVKDFSIHLDEDTVTRDNVIKNTAKRYKPGEVVSGTVVLDVARPLGVTHIIVRLSGFVEVFKNHKQRSSHAGDIGKSSKRRGKRWVSEYFGDGFASLFEDEVLVCTSGRLDPRTWHFKFKIAFPKQLNLPSSIEFERGQISYSVTATLTRQATLNPTTTKVRTIRYQDEIDIAQYPPPKPRKATLEPVLPPHVIRGNLRRLTSSDKTSFRLSSASTVRSAESKCQSNASSDEPASMADDSQRSSQSCCSESVRSAPLSEPSSPRTHAALGPQLSIELTKGACLRGHTVHLVVKVDRHVKRVQSVDGIIVTLYREGRTDFQPNLPISPDANGQAKYEDYYPRSRSGIGGMSLDNAGSDKKFQQDISQTIVPLIINHDTMSAEARVPVRIPDNEGVFPTLKGVPGNMISFRYFVEAVIDIHGKLPTQDRAFGKASSNQGSRTSTFESSSFQEPLGDTQTTPVAPRYVDTSRIRQHKHAVRLRSEIIIGTSDSSRSSAPTHVQRSQDSVVSGFREQEHPSRSIDPLIYDDTRRVGQMPYNEYHDRSGHIEPVEALGSNTLDRWRGDDHAYNRWGYHPYHDDYEDDHLRDDSHQFAGGYLQSYDYQPPPQFSEGSNHSAALRSVVPLPSFAHEEDLTEKERIARHEAALLPSEPGGAWPSNQVPSAPPVLEDHDRAGPGPSSSFMRSSGTVDAGMPHTVVHDQSGSYSIAPVQTPTFVASRDLEQGLDARGFHATSGALEEQELERRRLAEEASSPMGSNVSEETAPGIVPSMRVASEIGADANDRSGDERQDEAQRSRAEPHRSIEAEALPQYDGK